MGFFLFLLISVAIAALSLFAHAIHEDERKRERNSEEWLQFSMQHHCKVVRSSSFSDPATLWECEGSFQVRR